MLQSRSGRKQTQMDLDAQKNQTQASKNAN